MISTYDADRRKLDLRDFNEIIDHVNTSPMSYNGHNSESYPQGMSQGGNSKHKWSAFNLQPVGTGTIAVRQSRWRRNGNKATPAEIQDALAISTGQYELDYKFTPVEYGTGDYSTSTDGTDYYGMVYYVACLDHSNNTANYDTYEEWSTADFDINPALYPDRYHICKVKEEDIDDLYSGIPSHMDSCKRIVGAVKMAEDAWPLETYQYIDSDITDQHDSHPWDCFKVDGTNFYMLPGHLVINSETTSEIYTPTGLTKINNVSVYNLVLTQTSVNYIWLQWTCSSGTSEIKNSVVANQAESNATVFKKLLWTVTLDAYGKVSNFSRNFSEDVDYWSVVANVYWDIGSGGRLEYRTPNCESYRLIAQAQDCP